MAYFKNKTFKGIAPAISPRLLNEEYGQEAENIEFERGSLIPIKDNIDEFTLDNSSKSSIFKYKGPTTQWLQWDSTYDFVHAVEGPIASDTYDRVYWPGDATYPRYGGTADVLTSPAPYPTTSYKLGVDAPTSAPATTKGGTVATDETALEVSYVYTLVTAYGEEGPPSPPSTTVTKTSTETVTLDMPSAHAPTANRNFGAGAKKRIYRSNTGSTNTTFQFLGEVAVSAITYTDSTSSSALGEVLPSTTWVGPPNDDTSLYPDGPMQGLIAVANGVFAGFSGKRLCLSEAYLPHAWPVEYRITMEETIVALGATNNGIVVLTEGAPYFVTGTEPSAMTAIKVNLAQACLSKHSVVDMGEYVLYAGPDGLCAVTGPEGRVVSEGLISVDDWRNAQRPDLIKSFFYEGTYVAFYKKPDNSLGGWVYDPRATDNQFSTITVDAEVRGGYSNPTDGELYLIVGDKIKKYRGGTTNRTAKWKTKKYVTDTMRSMGWVSVHAASWPTTLTDAIGIKVYGDGNLIADYSIYNNSAVNETKVVTVAGGKFVIDGVSQDTLTLKEGSTYTFDQSDASNLNHPFRFSTTADGVHNSGVSYTQGVTINGTPGGVAAYTRIVVPTGAPTLYYYCGNHSGMGGTANTTTTSPYVMRNGSTDTNLYEPTMRLPATVAQEWEVEIQTKYEINEICIAQAIDEIKAA